MARAFSMAESTSLRTSVAENGEPLPPVLGFNRTDDRGLQRRLVLFEIERDLLVARPPHQRPDQQIPIRPVSASPTMTRKVMIAPAVKRQDSRPYADRSSTSTPSPTTPRAPRRASFMRQRRRTSWMIVDELGSGIRAPIIVGHSSAFSPASA